VLVKYQLYALQYSSANRSIVHCQQQLLLLLVVGLLAAVYRITMLIAGVLHYGTTTTDT
jgi:hypothetical protein